MTTLDDCARLGDRMGIEKCGVVRPASQFLLKNKEKPMIKSIRKLDRGTSLI